MALQNQLTKEYLKVYNAGFKDNRLRFAYKIFANSEQRQRFDEGLSDYENYQEGFKTVTKEEQLINDIADGKKSVKDNLITKCYEELKIEDEFKEWSDV